MYSILVASKIKPRKIIFFSSRSIKTITTVLLLSFFLLVSLSILGGHNGLCQVLADNRQQKSECGHCHHEEASTCHNEESEHLHDTLTLKLRSDETETVFQQNRACSFEVLPYLETNCRIIDRPPDTQDGLVLHKSIVMLI